MSHERFSECIQACHACAIACEHRHAACLAEDDVGMMTECIRLDHDCADICRLAAAWIARGSQFAPQLCALCATLCEAYGTVCAKHRNAHCQACAEACRSCAAECRRISQS